MVKRYLLLTILIAYTSAAIEAAEQPLSLLNFARQPAWLSVGLSHEGRYFSAVRYRGEFRELVIDEMNVEETPFRVTGNKWDIRHHRWISDTELLVLISYATRYVGTPVIVERLAYVNAEKRDVYVLFQREEKRAFQQLQGEVVSYLDHDPNRFLIQLRGEKAAVYRVGKKASRLPQRAHQRHMRDIYGWSADANGRVRMGEGWTNDQKDYVLKLRDSEDNWHDYGNLVASGFEVLAFPTHEPNVVYALSTGTGPYRRLQKFDVRTGEFGEVLAEHPNSDVANVQLNRTGDAIESISFESELVARQYHDPWLRSLMGSLNRALKDTNNFIAALSKDRSWAIVGAYNDHLPVHYYLFETAAMQASYLNTAYPGLIDRAPGRVHELTYTARDGLEIPAYLTLPQGVEPSNANKLPTVIYPHGGPHARDFKAFDWIAQMLTAQGYAVLQINFRGSTGYGLEFKQAGEKQWGQAMQDDITDGTQWLIDQGIADAQKICILGGSYGGYAALMGVAKEPGLYRCAVSFNGVADLEMLLRRSSRYVGGRFMTRFIGNLRKDKEMLRSNSPTRLAKQITAPVLLIHGNKDRVVDIAHSKRMARALGDQLHEFVVLPDGSHWLDRPSNRFEFANKTTEFLHTHLGGELLPR